jgi:hypothetical protein
MRIRRMREVLHIVDDAMLEAFTVGQATTLPPVHEIPERRVQVQNAHFCVLHGWTAVVPLPVVECGLPTASPSPPAPVFDAGSSASAPWMSIWRHHHRLRPLQRQLLVVRHLHQCLWSSGPLLPVVGSPRVPSMLHVDALSSLAIAQMVWPRLPPPTGGPNGPRSGRRIGRLGGGGGEQRGKPRRVRDL